MTELEFLQTKMLFDAGNVEFNHGQSVLAFSYQKRWYPAKAFVSQNIPDVNTYQSVVELIKIWPTLFFKEVNFINANGLPLEVTGQEIKDEMKVLAKRLLELVD